MNTDILARDIGKLIKNGSKDVLIAAYLFDIELQGGNFLSELLHRTANRIKYLPEPEGRDDWQSVGVTLLKKTGDCEDFCILIGAVLLKAGYPVLLKFTASKDDFDHVYPITWDGKNWIALDATLPNIGLNFEGSFSKSVIYSVSGEVIGEDKTFFISWLIPCIAIAIIVLILLRG